MNIQVIAKRLGYYKHKRRKEGAQFQMELKDFVPAAKVLDKDGKDFFKHGKDEYMVPTWVELADKVKAKPKVQKEDSEELETSEQEVI